MYGLGMMKDEDGRWLHPGGQGICSQLLNSNPSSREIFQLDFTWFFGNMKIGDQKMIFVLCKI